MCLFVGMFLVVVICLFVVVFFVVVVVFFFFFWGGGSYRSLRKVQWVLPPHTGPLVRPYTINLRHSRPLHFLTHPFLSSPDNGWRWSR